jgi:hypothetical protein
VSATLTGIARAFHNEGMTALGVLVYLTLVLLPGLEIATCCNLLVPFRFGKVPRALTAASRLLVTMRRWSMVEVFVLAAVVCMHRLAQIADLEVQAGFWAIGAMMLLFAMTDSIFDVRDLWAGPAGTSETSGRTCDRDGGARRPADLRPVRAVEPRTSGGACAFLVRPLRERAPCAQAGQLHAHVGPAGPAYVLYIPANVLRCWKRNRSSNRPRTRYWAARSGCGRRVRGRCRW